MRIAYITHTRFPTEKAHGHQIARVCEALAALGHEVTLVAPGVHNELKEDYKDYYDIKTAFTLKHLPTKDALLSRWIPGRFAMLFTMRSYRKALKAFFTEQTFNLLYARSPHVLGPMLATGIPTVLELHTLPRSGKAAFGSLCKKCTLVVCLTSPMKDELASWGVAENHILVEGDAVDMSRFEGFTGSFKLNSNNKPVIGYVGSLSTMDNLQKGVDLIVKAASKLKDAIHPHFFIVGGPDVYVHQYEKMASAYGLTKDDISFEGNISASQVPAAIATCDVCVYPAPRSNHPYFLRDTSPLKLFEYLAAGVPVVCADIPPVRDIVDESSVWFFSPGDVSSLASAISDALTKTEQSNTKAQKGKQIVQKHTWSKRMERILNSI